MSIGEYILKLAFLTLCVSMILYTFYPKYEFIDASHRCNKVTGCVEYFDTRTHRWR